MFNWIMIGAVIFFGCLLAFAANGLLAHVAQRLSGL